MKIKKKPVLNRKVILYIVVVVMLVLGLIILNKKNKKLETVETIRIEENKILPTLVPTIKQLSFDELNKIFGPCVKVNVLMYHHIQSNEEASLKKQNSLSVTPDFFRKHLQYLKDNNYSLIEVKDLIDFFDGNKKLSGKLAMITLDDAYQDNYTNAYPILKELGIKATIFSPTGLINNLDYLTWDEMNQMKDLVYFGNHTWSHHSSSGTKETLEQEVSLADNQLVEKGLNDQKVFAYPYGKPSGNAQDILRKKGYKIAFTTNYGNIMCKNKALELPRIRVGNAALSSFGL